MTNQSTWANALNNKAAIFNQETASHSFISNFRRSGNNKFLLLNPSNPRLPNYLYKFPFGNTGFFCRRLNKLNLSAETFLVFNITRESGRLAPTCKLRLEQTQRLRTQPLGWEAFPLCPLPLGVPLGYVTSGSPK